MIARAVKFGLVKAPADGTMVGVGVTGGTAVLAAGAVVATDCGGAVE